MNNSIQPGIQTSLKEILKLDNILVEFYVCKAKEKNLIHRQKFKLPYHFSAYDQLFIYTSVKGERRCITRNGDLVAIMEKVTDDKTAGDLYLTWRTLIKVVEMRYCAW